MGILHHTISAASRGRMSNIIPQNEVDTVFAITNMIESTAPLISSLTLGLLYTASIEKLPSAVFYFVSVISCVNIIISG